MGAGLDVGAYVLGSACVLAAVVVLGWGAWSARAALLPRWSGCNARLAEITIALTITFVVAQVLGSVGLLRLGPVLAGEMVVGGAAGLLGRRAHRPSAPRPRPATASSGVEVALVVSAVAVVAVQWTGHVGYAVSHGMTHADTLWYHMPFAARFAQAGSFPRLDGIGYPAAQWFPLNSQLLHTLAFLPFRRDVLSPYLNLGWAVLAVLAAWCIGQRRNVGAISVAGAAVVLGLPTLAGTQPGQASSDIACAALFVTAVALLLESGLEIVPIGLAAAAAGLAISTKVTVAVPVLVLTILVVGYLLVRRYVKSAGAWLVGVAITGSFWFLRNWVLADNPLPWFSASFGPLSLPASVKDQGPTLVDAGLLNTKAWRNFYLPGLHQGFGAAWIAILVIGIGGGALMVFHRNRPLDQIVGGVALVGVAAYLFTPQSAGFSFVFNLRYLGPMLLLGFAAAPLSLPTSKPWRTGQLVVAAGLVAIEATAAHHERVPAWPRETLVAGVAVVLGVGAYLLVRPRPALRRHLTSGLVAAAALLLVAIVGWPLQREYLDRRYAAGGIPPNDGIPAYFRGVRDARVVLFGGIESYPLFGPDLSNRVRLGSDPPPRPGRDACRWWRNALNGRYDYIVVTDLGFGLFIRPPDDVIAGDRAAKAVLRHGNSVVYRVRGRMHPDACPARVG